MKAIRVYGILFSAMILSMLILCSCGFELFGPAFPGRDATKYLENHGEDKNTIKKVTELQEMPLKDFARFTKSPDNNVRYLIALNPHTPKSLLYVLVTDSDGFVHQGVALNPAIDEGLINECLKNKELLCELVRNPSVPQETILKIYHENNLKSDYEKIYLSWFAMNPKCPQKIKDDIMGSNDESAKSWLKNTEEMERQRKLPPPKKDETPCCPPKKPLI